MKFTHFYHPECDRRFNVKYAIEQDVADVEYCPCCGGSGRMEKKGVTQMDGVIVSKTGVVD